MVRAAAELMHVRGVHATSVDDVLAASGTGKSQFYRYFKSKDELVQVVLEHQMQKWLKRAGPFLVRLDSWQGFEEWFEEIVKFQSDRGFVGGCPVGSLAGEMADADPELRVKLVEAFRARRRHIANGLAAMRDRGELASSADPEGLSEFVLATIQGALLLASTEKDARALRRTLEQTLAHLRSFATPPGAEHQAS